MEITLVVPDNKLAEFRLGFLAAYPVPVPMIDNPEGSPEYTELEWFRVWLKQRALEAYIQGKKKLATQAVVIDREVIELDVEGLPASGSQSKTKKIKE